MSASFSQVSYASTSSSKKLLLGYSKEIAELQNQAKQAEILFANSKKQNESLFTAESLKLDDVYSQTIRDISTNLKSKLDSATNLLANAKAKWTQVNKVKLTTGFFGSDLERINNVLDCIAPYSDGSSPFMLVKRYCANNGNYPKPGDRVPDNPLVTYGGADWQKNDITTINVVNANDKYLADGIKFGFVVPLNPTDFDSTKKQILESTLDVEKWTNEITKANKNAIDARDSGKYNAREQFILRANSAERDYQKTIAKIDAELEPLTFGQSAAKRAAKQKVALKTAFTTALQFSYNVQRLDDIASEPLSFATSLKALNSIVKITALSEEADGVDASYTHNRALKINKLCGNVFISEAKFREFNSSAKIMYARYVLG